MPNSPLMSLRVYGLPGLISLSALRVIGTTTKTIETIMIS